MNIIIAGSRALTDYNKLKINCLSSITKLNNIFMFNLNDVIIISGKCKKGADKLGESFANEMNFPIQSFPAEWRNLKPIDEHGHELPCFIAYANNGTVYNKIAGMNRNTKMAKYCSLKTSALIAFWDYKSSGTKHMIAQAKIYNIYTIIIDIR